MCFNPPARQVDQQPRKNHLAHGDGIQELGLGQPVPAVHQVGLQEGQEDIPAPEHYGAKLQEGQEEAPEADRRQSIRWQP